jgi:ABC-type lipoprotein release transport system permease subunit
MPRDTPKFISHTRGTHDVGGRSTRPGITIPWLTVVGFLVAGVGFALLMTWLPARRAASIPIAESLRYE